MKLAFGPMAGRNHDLFQNLRNMSLGRDISAPVYLSEEDLQGFEQYRNLSGYRASLEVAKKAGNVKAMKLIKSSLEGLIHTLSEWNILEKRNEYFNRVDDLQARGLSTTEYVAEFTLEHPFPRKPDSGTTLKLAPETWTNGHSRKNCRSAI